MNIKAQYVLMLQSRIPHASFPHPTLLSFKAYPTIVSGHHQQKHDQEKQNKHTKSKANKTQKSTQNSQFPRFCNTLLPPPSLLASFSDKLLCNTFPPKTRRVNVAFGHQSHGTDGKACMGPTSSSFSWTTKPPVTWISCWKDIGSMG